MRILFVHQNFPGQFRHLAPAMAARGHQVVALRQGQPREQFPGVTIEHYKLPRGNTPGIHPWALPFESKVVHAEAAGRAALTLKAGGFTPDLIYVHPSWGESLGLREVWPRSCIVSFCEFHYHPNGADTNFDPEFGPPDWASDVRVRIKNAAHHLAMELADYGISPTEWQRAQLPEWFRPHISVVHDGIDTDAVMPNPQAQLGIQSRDVELHAGDEVITFVSRTLEPYRGYHVFMRALPEILRRRPNARALIVGSSEGGYGAAAPAGKTWRQIFLEEAVAAGLDLSRVHFLGRIPYPAFVSVLQVSAVHVYLSYPFVLSWSLLEAMSAGCLIVGSNTPPVAEVIRHGQNGVLVDFFDVGGLVDAVSDGLSSAVSHPRLRQAARQTVLDRYDLRRICLPRQIELLEKFSAA
jgi:glycosyltransferase involved in cell wall biosynthesis